MPRVLGDDYARCTERFPGPNPFGQDPSTDPTFMDLKAEMGKLTAQSSKEGGIEWKKARGWAIEILGTKSKDLNSAAFLAFILPMTDGFAGLADGLAVFSKLIRDDWEGVFPPASRMRARANAFVWLGERVGELAANRVPVDSDKDAVAEIHRLVEELVELAPNRFPPPPPALTNLVAAANRAAASFEVAAPPPAEEETAPQPAPSSAATPASPAPHSSASPALPPAEPLAAGANTSEVRERIRPLVAPLRAADPSNPMAYRILRALKWDGLVGPPTAVPDTGRTSIPAPRAQLRASLEAMANAEKWIDLLHASEGAFAEGFGTFWLDLQRFSATALEGLGGSDGKAAHLVREEAHRFVQSWPQIPSLSFKDGTPFVDDMTRGWLGRIAKEASGAESGPAVMSFAAPASATGDEPVLEAEKLREVQELFSKKRPAAALDLLQGAIEASTRDRQRFQARLLAARLCLQANQVDWARTLVDDLLREAEEFSFVRWEPAVATSLYELSAVCYGRLVKDRKGEERESLRPRFEDMKARVFRLDMRAAALLEETLRRL